MKEAGEGVTHVVATDVTDKTRWARSQVGGPALLSLCCPPFFLLSHRPLSLGGRTLICTHTPTDLPLLPPACLPLLAPACRASTW